MADIKELAEELVGLTIKEANELANHLEEEYDIQPASAGVAVAADGGGGADGEAEEDREERGIETLPSTLGQAISALQEDDVILDALGAHVSEKFTQAKTQEYTEFLASVSQWELDRYLETF